jgi:hypothetical protein
MPGELGDEQSQPGVGYYEHKYDPDPDFFQMKVESPEGAKPHKDRQLKRVLDRLRAKKYRNGD